MKFHLVFLFYGIAFQINLSTFGIDQKSISYENKITSQFPFDSHLSYRQCSKSAKRHDFL